MKITLPDPEDQSPEAQALRIQDAVVCECMGYAARNRMTNAEFAKNLGISVSYWADLRNLRKSITVDLMLASAAIMGTSMKITFVPVAETKPTEESDHA